MKDGSGSWANKKMNCSGVYALLNIQTPFLNPKSSIITGLLFGGQANPAAGQREDRGEKASDTSQDLVVRAEKAGGDPGSYRGDQI